MGKTPAIADHQARKLLVAPAEKSLKGLRDRAILATPLYHDYVFVPKRSLLCCQRRRPSRGLKNLFPNIDRNFFDNGRVEVREWQCHD